MRQGIWSWVKWTSLAVSLGSLLLAILLMQMRTQVPTPLADQQPGKNPDNQTEVSSPLIVEKKGDRMIWKLQAERAQQELNGKMHLASPQLTLFTDAGEAIPVQGLEAWFDPIQRNIEFQGDVRIRYENWKLSSDKVLFRSSDDQLLIPGKFDIRGETLQAKGKSLRLDRRNQKLWVDQGIWIKDESAKWQPEK